MVPAEQPAPAADSTMTLRQYLSMQEQLELEARTALPRKFDTCSYGLGYLRQQLYVCRDCTTDGRVAAVCYACSIACHPSCSLVELHVRRHFRCDCGNSRSASECRLYRHKDACNEENSYGGSGGHNFEGRFCTCDAEEGEGEAMLQCLVCQDWFHDQCIGVEVASEACEYLCAACVRERPCLGSVQAGQCLASARPEGCLASTRSEECRASARPEECLASACPEECRADAHPGETKGVLLTGDWRKRQCRCDQCFRFLDREGLGQLWEEETIYEPEIDDDPIESIYDRGMRLLTTLKQPEAIRVAERVQKLKDGLMGYLAQLPSEHSVTKQDIEVFFENYRQQERQDIF